MWTVWNTLHEDEVTAMIKHARRQRYSTDNEDVEMEAVLMSDHWKNEMQDMPYKSKKRGRMSKLLKQKSKVGKDMKPRKTYDAYVFAPRARDSSLRA